MTTRTIFAAFVALSVTCQAIRFEQTNPPVVGDVEAPPAVESALRGACYGCHSNETKWPWYAGIAPISWLAHHDVTEGRRRLNFSLWSDYAGDPGTKLRKLERMRDLVRSGDMPPWYYRLAHFGSRWTDAQREAVAGWIDQQMAPTANPE